MDIEALKLKLALALAERGCPQCHNAGDSPVATQRKELKMNKEAQIEEIDKVITKWLTSTKPMRTLAPTFYAAGYRKFPLKPKVLSDEEIAKVLNECPVPILCKAFRTIAHAQLDSAWEEIKRHYEGVEDV